MSDPVISVIIPAYNAQEHIRECLESVLAQSFRDFEIIVIDDGSDDDTGKIAARMALTDRRVVVDRIGNSGVSVARNRGVSLARGEWVAFVDSDDKLLPGALEKLYEISNQTGCGIVKGRYVKEYGRNARSKGGKTRVWNCIELIKEILYQRFCDCSACGAIYRRDIINGTSFTPGERYEDLDFFYRAFIRAEKIAVTDLPVYYYRDNPTSFVNSFSFSRLDVLKVTERLEHFMNESYPQLTKAAKDRRLSANFNMFALMGVSGLRSEEIESAMNGCWNLIRKYRRGCLSDPKVRLKNKLGALLSLFGEKMFLTVAKRVYR